MCEECGNPMDPESVDVLAEVSSILGAAVLPYRPDNGTVIVLSDPFHPTLLITPGIETDIEAAAVSRVLTGAMREFDGEWCIIFGVGRESRAGCEAIAMALAMVGARPSAMMGLHGSSLDTAFGHLPSRADYLAEHDGVDPGPVLPPVATRDMDEAIERILDEGATGSTEGGE